VGLLLGACFPAAPIPPGATVLHNATLWTGDGVLEDATIVIVDGSIRHIRQSLPPETRWADHVALDLQGDIVIPGLSDANVRLADPATPALLGDFTLEAAYANLRLGVTTVVDTGSPIWTTNLRDRIAAGDIQGPTLLVSDAG